MCKKQHNSSCTMAFGRMSTHNECPRCEELKAGAQPRKGYSAQPKYQGNRLDAYCFSVAIYHSRCTAVTNPSCACGKMSYTD